MSPDETFEMSASLVENLTQLSFNLHADNSEAVIWDALSWALYNEFGYRPLTAPISSKQHDATRIYSSDNKMHPLGSRDPGSRDDSHGRNEHDFLPPRQDDWVKRVLVEGMPWLGSTPEDLKLVFEDGELLVNAGLGSVMNIPVRVSGRTIGSINILDETHAYDKSNQRVAILIAQIVAAYIQKVAERVGVQ